MWGVRGAVGGTLLALIFRKTSPKPSGTSLTSPDTSEPPSQAARKALARPHSLGSVLKSTNVRSLIK